MARLISIIRWIKIHWRALALSLATALTAASLFQPMCRCPARTTAT